MGSEIGYPMGILQPILQCWRCFWLRQEPKERGSCASVRPFPQKMSSSSIL